MVSLRSWMLRTCVDVRVAAAPRRQVTDEDVAAIEALGEQGGLFERLASSIAPEIYGMTEVKKVSGLSHGQAGRQAGEAGRRDCWAILRSAHERQPARTCWCRWLTLLAGWLATATLPVCCAAAPQALLLQMVGGVAREFPGSGMKLRGDIHICLMGDPGAGSVACRVFVE